MKFIPGKYYKTRDGRKARFVGITLHNANGEEFWFEVTGKGECWGLLPYNEYGNNSNPTFVCSDIVSEWCDHPSVMSDQDAGTFYCGVCKEPVGFTSPPCKKEKPKKIEKFRTQDKYLFSPNVERDYKEVMNENIKLIVEKLDEIIDAVNELRGK